MSQRFPSLLSHGFLALACTFVISGCTRIGFWTVNSLSHFKDYTRYSNISYGSHSHQKIDIYTPESIDEDEKLPVIIFFYGGGWTDGDKEDYLFAAQEFVELGYVVAIPDYAKYPEYTYPAWIEDGAEAVAWVKTQINQYHADSNLLFIVGHSAGAHLGAMLITQKDFLKQVDVPYSSVKGFAGLAGPYDFVPKKEIYKRVFSPVAPHYAKAMPATYVDGSEPPMLFLYGNSDSVVGISNLENMLKKCRETEAPCSSEIYDGVGHIGMMRALSPLSGNYPPVANEIDAFFSAQLP